MSLSQNDTGRAFEYGIALSLSNCLPAPLQDGVLLQKAKQCFNACSQKEQQNIVAAAREVAWFLAAHDIRLSDTGCSVYLQSDQLGQKGDVRDIVVRNTTLNADIGISAKNRHVAVKHSRLSEDIDFGSDWLGLRCSDNYRHTISPIFQELRARKGRGEMWRDVPDKKQQYYMPIMSAFRNEMLALYAQQPAGTAKALVQYLLGRFDYYKVIKQRGTVSVTSFNINGSLRWGSKLPMPTRIMDISLKPGSNTTLLMFFDNGWQISFRIHSASSLVEPSLKFDVKLIGLPEVASRHVMVYNA